MAAPYGYWTFGGKNGLQGAASTILTLSDGREVLVKDPDNPAVLEDIWIINALLKEARARKDYNLLYPDLDQESQERLDDLLADNPRVLGIMLSDKEFLDQIQHNQVTRGVHLG